MELFSADIPTWAFLSFIVLIQVLWYFFRKYNYWKTQGITCAPRYPLLGSIQIWKKAAFHEVEEERYKKYGRLYGYYEGSIPMLSCAEPDILRDILVKDFEAFPSGRDFTTGDPITDNMLSFLRGEDWKRMRTVMTPGFTLRKLRIVCERLKDCSKSLIENFSNAIKKNSTIECRGFIDCFALDVMSSSLFGTRIDSCNDPNNEFIKTGHKLFTIQNNWLLILAIILPKLAKYLGFSIFNDEGMKCYVKLGERIIKDRRESGKRQNDFLQVLIDANENALNPEDDDDKGVDIRDESVEVGQDNYKKVLQQNVKSKSASDVEILAQCTQFLLGSFEGVGGTMACACYLLAMNPKCQEKVIEEIDDAFHKNDEMDYTVIRDMTYLDGVIKETMRIFPPLGRVEKQAKRDYRLGNTGIIIPKGGVVTIPIIGMHRDAGYFPDPEKFIPERFFPENKADIVPYTYLPFSAGLRNCIGMRLVLLEVKYCIIQLFRHFRFSISPETEVPPRVEFGQFLLSPRSLKLKVEARTDVSNRK